MRYSPERKEAVLKKMMPPHNRTIKELVADEGVSDFVQLAPGSPFKGNSDARR